LNQLFHPITTLTERFTHRSSLSQLAAKGWTATTVENEYKNPDAPGFSIEVDLTNYGGKGHFVIYQGNKRLGYADQPPYASHLNLRSMH
jgi:hypothetical protein